MKEQITSKALVLFSAIQMLFLSACGEYFKLDHEPAFAEKEMLDALRNKKKAEILETLGSPHQIFTKETVTYYLYSADSEGRGYFWVFPMPFSTPNLFKEGGCSCVLLEFDSGDRLSDHCVYAIPERWGGCDYAFYESKRHIGVPCRQMTAPDFFKGIQAPSEEVLRTEAAIGNVTAQWKLYIQGKSANKYDLKLLCELAENGHAYAQRELGYLYAYGAGGVPKDLVHSVMWLNRSENAGVKHVGGDTIRGKLTPKQLGDVKHLSDEWKPGQCARELVDVKLDSNH